MGVRLLVLVRDKLEVLEWGQGLIFMSIMNGTDEFIVEHTPMGTKSNRGIFYS